MWHFHSIPDNPPFVSFWDISRCHESEADMQQNVSVRRTPPAEEKRMQCQLLPATSQTIRMLHTFTKLVGETRWLSSANINQGSRARNADGWMANKRIEDARAIAIVKYIIQHVYSFIRR